MSSVEGCVRQTTLFIDFVSGTFSPLAFPGVVGDPHDDFGDMMYKWVTNELFAYSA